MRKSDNRFYAKKGTCPGGLVQRSTYSFNIYTLYFITILQYYTGISYIIISTQL